MIARVIATWFGCGYFPKGPGTAGSLGALIVAWPLHEYFGFGPPHFFVLTLVCFWPACWASTMAARSLGKKDPQVVVVDEVIGQWLTLCGTSSYTWKTWLTAFVLFRAFDILKPPPVRQFEKLPEGLGIVADDAMAGVYGAILLWLTGTLISL